MFQMVHRLYTKQFFFVYLKLEFNWMPCILSGKTNYGCISFLKLL